jgi:tetratricopeptide (TPR) repeat protein
VVKAVPVLFLLLRFLSPSAAHSQTTQEQIERFFHAGQRDLQQGNFSQAVDEFKKVLTLNPTLLEAEVNLGLSYQSLFEYDLAVQHLAKALQSRPSLLGPTVIVGLDYLKLGSTAKAIPFLQQALKLDPANRDAREALATAYLSQEDFASAAAQFQQMASLENDKSEALFKLGHEYLDLAARLAYRGAHQYRESAWGHRFLGDLLVQRGQSEDALKEYQKAINAEPQQPGIHTALGQAYLLAQRLSEAEKEFRLDLQLDSRNELAWLGLATTQLAIQRPSAALESVRKIWEISPEFLAQQHEFPSVELPPDSLNSSRVSVEGAPATPAQHFLVAGLCAALNDRPCANLAWKSFQSDFAAWQPPMDKDACQAHLYSRCAASMQTRKHLTDADRLLLGKNYLILQQYSRAAESFSQVQGISKENVEASYWLARTYQAQGTEAYALLQESFHDSWRACQFRAEGAALRGNIDGAIKEFHAALQLRPDEPELHEALGQLYLDHHTDETAAQVELEKALAPDPFRKRALYLLGRLYVEKKDNEKALPYLERALRLQPDFIEANSLLGTVYLRLGHAAEAVPKLLKAAPSDHYGNVHYQLYQAYRKLGKPDLAQKELALSQDLRRSYLERDEAIIMGSPQPETEPR